MVFLYRFIIRSWIEEISVRINLKLAYSNTETIKEMIRIIFIVMFCVFNVILW